MWNVPSRISLDHTIIQIVGIILLKGESNMGAAPNRCPMCGEVIQWKLVDTSNKGFSVGKAAVGGILLGPVGLLGGALGKKKKTYYCGKCGFHHEY